MYCGVWAPSPPNLWFFPIPAYDMHTRFILKAQLRYSGKLPLTELV